MQVEGIHHITAITSSAPQIHAFFTDVLGLRLVKKNVNQDDLSSYHLYFGDRKGSPGTVMTFFDFKGLSQGVCGSDSIERISFRVASKKAFCYWEKRLEHFDVSHLEMQSIFDRDYLFFEDFDGQKYAIVNEESNRAFEEIIPWTQGPIPEAYELLGFGPPFLKVSSFDKMEKVLLDVMHMDKIEEDAKRRLYTMKNDRQILVEASQEASARQGYGSVHHLAFRVKDEDQLQKWIAYFDRLGLQHSGYVDRFYFKSLYFRAYPNILFEIATDGPGFIDDEEDVDDLGTTLTLPPHLRKHRSYIESLLEPFPSSDKRYKKEFLNE